MRSLAVSLVSFLRMAACLLLPMLTAAQVQAAFIGKTSAEGVEYFLFSAPDRIERYDTSARVFLPAVDLPEAARSLAVVNASTAYVAQGARVYRYDFVAGTRTLARTHEYEVEHVLLLNAAMVVIDYHSMTALSLTDNHVLGRHYTRLHAAKYTAAPALNAIFLYSDYSNTYRISLNVDGTFRGEEGSTYGGDFNMSTEMYAFAAGTRIANQFGHVLTEDLRYAGRFNGAPAGVADAGGDVVVIRGTRVERYDALLRYVDGKILDFTPRHVAVLGDRIFLFAISDTAVSARIILVSDLNGLLPLATAYPGDAVVMPARVVADTSGHRLFLLDRFNNSIFVWSLQDTQWLPGYRLPQRPTQMTYSAAANRLYLGYDDGRITYIDTLASSAKEMPFATLRHAVHAMAAAGSNIFAVNNGGGDATYYVFSPEGRPLDEREHRQASGYQGSGFFEWNVQRQRIYHFNWGSSDNDLRWESIEPATGLLNSFLKFSLRTPFWGYGTGPIRISDDGSQVATGGGYIVDADSLAITNTLTTPFLDAAWIDGRLFALERNGDAVKLVTHAADFSRQSSLHIADSGNAWLFADGGELALVTATGSGTEISVLDPFAIPDADSDGVIDPVDNCPLDANAGQRDDDHDGIGNVCDADKDNDRIPNADEVLLGLDPANAQDALLDPDHDGASTVIEFLNGSDPLVAASSPAKNEGLLESFEAADWQDGHWYVPPAGHFPPMRVRQNAVDGDYSLRFAVPVDGGRSELEFSGMFAGGALTYHLDQQREFMTPHEFSVYVDGRLYGSYLESAPSTVHRILLATGEHRIRFVYSHDAGYDYINYSVFLDRLEFVASDHDADGVYDYRDNCSAIANAGQENFDADWAGDACDEDDDNDGVNDSVELRYISMNPFDPTDLLQDADGDGVLNVHELFSDIYSPDIFDVYPVIESAEYLPVADYRAVYRGPGLPVTRDWRAVGEGRWEVTGTGVRDIYEQRVDGFFLLSRAEQLGGNVWKTWRYESGLPVFLANMQLQKQYVSSVHVDVDVGGTPYDAYELAVTLRLARVDPYLYGLEELPMVFISSVLEKTGGLPDDDDWSAGGTWVKTLGLEHLVISRWRYSLTEIAEIPPPTEPEPVAANSGGSWPLAGSALLVLLMGRGLFRRKSVQVFRFL